MRMPLGEVHLDYILFFCLSLGLTSCSSQSFRSSDATQKQIPRQFSSDPQRLDAPLTPEMNEALKKTSFEMYYSNMLKLSSDNAIVINGIQFDQTRTQIESLKPIFELMDERFGNLGEWLADADMSENRSAAEIQEELEDASDFNHEQGALFDRLQAIRGRSGMQLAKQSPTPPPIEGLPSCQVTVGNPSTRFGIRCGIAMGVAGVKDIFFGAAAATGVGAPAAAAAEESTAWIDAIAITCTATAIEAVASSISEYYHNQDCPVDVSVEPAPGSETSGQGGVSSF